MKKTLFETANSLTPGSRQKVVALLNQALADLSDLYSQAKQAHWNVRGRSFYSLHKLFDELAGMVEAHIDPTAERITALGGVAQGTVRQAASHSALSEFPTKQPDEMSYVTALVERFGQCATSVRRGIDETAALGDAGTADLLTGLSQDLDKAVWFLEAHSRE